MSQPQLKPIEERDPYAAKVMDAFDRQSANTLSDLYDAQQNLGKERGKVTLMKMALLGARAEFEYIMESGVSIPIYAACSTRIEEIDSALHYQHNSEVRSAQPPQSSENPTNSGECE